MAVSSVNPYSSLGTRAHYTGLSGSGLDTDALVTQLMKSEKIPLDKLMQKKQLAEWKRDSYRDVTTLLQGFQRDFFDILKPESNMRSAANYFKYTTKSSDSTVVTATGGADVSDTTHTIIVNGLATAASVSSAGAITKDLIGSAVSSFDVNSYNNSFNLTYNGVTKTITLPIGTYADAASIVGNGTDGKLKDLVKKAFSGLDVAVNGSSIQFVPASPSDTINLTANLKTDQFLADLNLGASGNGFPLQFPLSIPQGRKFTVTITEGSNTTTKELEWASSKDYNDSTTLAQDIQTMLDAAFGTNASGQSKVKVDGSSGGLSFTTSDGINMTLSNSMNNNKVLSNLGMGTVTGNKLNLNDTLQTVSSKLSTPINFISGQVALSINGKVITAKSNETLQTLINRVNASDAGVKMSYSAYNNEFKIEAKQTGEGNIALNDFGCGFLAAAKLTDFEPGKNSSFELDGVPGSRVNNTFTEDGVTYNLVKENPGVKNSITLTADTDAVYKSIKSFVDKYNEVMSTLNTKLSEKYNRDYQPLTQDQRDAMKEDDIKNWETKAKTGLLKDDDMVSKVVNDVRKALFDPIEGLDGVSLASLGITTGSWDQKGKLVIDEAKLKDAITNKPNIVMKVFSQESDIGYSADNKLQSKNTRYAENGVINRINDILQDSVRTVGGKGDLLKKAGMVGDSTEYKNLIYDDIYDYSKEISDLAKKLVEKENNYYKKFSALETALSKMNSQGSWLSSQLGQSGS